MRIKPVTYCNRFFYTTKSTKPLQMLKFTNKMKILVVNVLFLLVCVVSL